jgi:two-component sensor histidine kinase
MHFDIRTLYIVFTFVFALCSIVLFINWRIHRGHFPEIRYYFLCMFIYTISLFLQSLTGIIPDFMTGSITLFFSLIAPFMLYRGLCLSDSRPFMDNANIALVSLAFPLLFYFGFIDNNLVGRGITWAIFSSAIFLRIFLLLRSHREGSELARKFLMATAMLHIISALSMLPISSTVKNNNLMEPNIYLGIDLVVLFGIGVLLTLGLVLLYSSKLQSMEHKLAEEKSLLLSEMNHRTKNNLAIINGLLLLKSEAINNKDAISALEESSSRVISMGILYDILHKDRGLNSVDIKIYIEELVAGLAGSLAASSVHIECDINDSMSKMNMEHAVPLGLIVNELVTNSIKYAFPDNAKGKIDISLKGTGDGEYELRIKDNGIGLPENLDINKVSSLGLAIVRNYTEQLDGALIVDRENGMSTSIRFTP